MDAGKFGGPSIDYLVRDQHFRMGKGQWPTREIIIIKKFRLEILASKKPETPASEKAKGGVEPVVVITESLRPKDLGRR